MESLLVAVPVLSPAMMLLLARHTSVGRIRRHPEHEHAVVLATRYMVLSYAVCFGLPVLLQAMLGATWVPVAAVGLAMVVMGALARRLGTGRDSDMETWVHVLFGGLTGTLVLCALMVLARSGGMAAGVGGTAGAGPSAVLLFTALVQTLAFVPLCTPLVRLGGFRRQLPEVPELNRWPDVADVVDFGQALQTDEAPM